MEKLKYPVGIESFEKLREEGYVYVDKTEYVDRLVRDHSCFFLSRPRRFGKSLLLSTIKAFFEGKKNLFEGLDIMKYDHDWKPYPVFHLNLVNTDTSSEDGLKSIINAQISRWEEIYGKEDVEDLEFPQRFYNVIRRASEQAGRRVVVLVDEYDKAIVATLDDKVLNGKFRAILKPLFGTLKAADEYIRFAMITGVSRFSRMSIFSDINNLQDITLLNDFNAICGITEEELQCNFSEGIRNLGDSSGISYDEAFRRLKRNYDGYHFSESCPDIYNPFSLISALKSREIKPYWFETGTPTFLIKALRDSADLLPDTLHDEADTTDLADVETYSDSPVALLFQTGYLTIKSYDPDFGVYRLGLPNKEVETGFFKDLLPSFMDISKVKGMKEIRKFGELVEEGKANEFLEKLQSFLADIPYYLSKSTTEIYFENNLYIIFKLLGYRVSTEYATSQGRIDLLLSTERFNYVMELKLNGTAEDALRQIDEKNYLLPFRRDGRSVFKIGISFSVETRNIDKWIIESV